MVESVVIWLNEGADAGKLFGDTKAEEALIDAVVSPGDAPGANGGGGGLRERQGSENVDTVADKDDADKDDDEDAK